MVNREHYPNKCPECGQPAWYNPGVLGSHHAWKCSNARCRHADPTPPPTEALDAAGPPHATLDPNLKLGSDPLKGTAGSWYPVTPKAEKATHSTWSLASFQDSLTQAWKGVPSTLPGECDTVQVDADESYVYLLHAIYDCPKAFVDMSVVPFLYPIQAQYKILEAAYGVAIMIPPGDSFSVAFELIGPTSKRRTIVSASTVANWNFPLPPAYADETVLKLLMGPTCAKGWADNMFVILKGKLV